jgi:hypothetical protein
MLSQPHRILTCRNRNHIHGYSRLGRICLALVLGVLTIQTVAAQNLRKPTLSVYPDTVKSPAPYVFKLVAGDLVLIQGNRPATGDTAKRMVGDSIRIVSPTVSLADERAMRIDVGSQLKNAALIAQLKERQALNDTLTARFDSLQTHWANVNGINNRSVDSLTAYYRHSDSLTGAALANVRKAVRNSYVTAGLVGAVGGGLAPGFDHSPAFNLLGAVTGAAFGIAVNWLVFQVF